MVRFQFAIFVEKATRVTHFLLDQSVIYGTLLPGGYDSTLAHFDDPIDVCVVVHVDIVASSLVTKDVVMAHMKEFVIFRVVLENPRLLGRDWLANLSHVPLELFLFGDELDGGLKLVPRVFVGLCKGILHLIVQLADFAEEASLLCIPIKENVVLEEPFILLWCLPSIDLGSN